MSPNQKIIKVPGDTIHQRKLRVQQFFKNQAYPVEMKQITQKDGILKVQWEPPFSETLLQRTEVFAKYGRIYFTAKEEEPAIAFIDMVFEQAPSLFAIGDLGWPGHKLESRVSLPGLLEEYVQFAKEQRARIAQIHAEVAAEVEAARPKTQEEENRQAYQQELEYWQIRKEETRRYLQRAKSATSIKAYKEDLVQIEKEIEGCHKTYSQLTGKPPDKPADLWSSATHD